MKELGERCKTCICRDCVNSHKYANPNVEVCKTFCEKDCYGGTKYSLNNYLACEYKAIYMGD